MNPLTNVKNLQKLNERELELGIVGKKSWHDEYKDSAWVFIGGLPYDLTEGDVICVFSQYGEVVNLNLVRDHKTGKSKGFGFLCFEDQRSTVLTVDNLNGIKILGRTLRVDHVKDYKIPKEFGDEDEVTLKIRDEGVAPKIFPSNDEEVNKEETSGEQNVRKRAKKDKKNKKQKKKKKRKTETSSSSSSSDSDEQSTKIRASVEIKQEKQNTKISASFDIKQEKFDKGYEKALKTLPSSRHGQRNESSRQDRFRSEGSSSNVASCSRDRIQRNESTRPDKFRSEGSSSNVASCSRDRVQRKDRGKHGNSSSSSEERGVVQRSLDFDISADDSDDVSCRLGSHSSRKIKNRDDENKRDNNRKGERSNDRVKERSNDRERDRSNNRVRESNDKGKAWRRNNNSLRERSNDIEKESDRSYERVKETSSDNVRERSNDRVREVDRERGHDWNRYNGKKIDRREDSRSDSHKDTSREKKHRK